MRARPATLLLVAALLAPWTTHAQDDDLERINAEIAARETALRDLSREERSITRALGELDESISRLDARAVTLEREAEAARRRVAEAETDAARLSRDLEGAEARLRGRLRGLYRLGPMADVDVLLGSRSLKELVWRRTVLRRLAQADATLARDVMERRAALLRERETILASRKDLDAARVSLEAARRSAVEARQARAAALQDVGAQKGAAQARLEELAASRRRLRNLMDDLPPAADATGFAALRGKLPWPTRGDVAIPFGMHEEDGAAPVMHSGISIDAPLGQQVHALAHGRVVHAGWLRGFGQLLIVDHGEGYHSLMAHLSRIDVKAGDTVEAGDTVAYVGDSESLHGPRLYVELRARGRPVDPLKWLAR